LKVVALAQSLESKFVDTRQRQGWMSVLAKAQPNRVISLLRDLTPPKVEVLRAPETGMVMVRGRAGSDGGAFNLGEMTVTRCVVRLGTGETGVGYVAGRNKQHAHAAAVIDAMLQSSDLFDQVRSAVIAPLEAERVEHKHTAALKAAATKVDFFTMVRDRQG
jgi:alpha-D-ribose 1-methylphosphonate 5-triphosphate synthase subunit PhnG